MFSPIIISISKETPDIDTILAGIVHVHASCIKHDHTMATFLPPLSFSHMLQWWQGKLEEVARRERYIWVEIQPVSSRKAQLESPLTDSEAPILMLDEYSEETFEVSGLVSLHKPITETGSFRGGVEVLLVSPNHRQKRVARRVMTELERVAMRDGRWNLLLGTEVGSPAEGVYPRMGYIRVGVIPDRGYSPLDGTFRDEVWFYKDLRKSTLFTSSCG